MKSAVLAFAAALASFCLPASAQYSQPRDPDFPNPPPPPNAAELVHQTNSVELPSHPRGPSPPDSKLAPLSVFFPPSPPLYGSLPAEPGPAPAPNLHLREPPDGLGNYVNEFFYPALSTRLFARTLDENLARQLDAYLAERAALVNELQNVLVTLHDADADTRERELRAFAAAQTPRIAAHEAEAERLREKIIQPGWTKMSSVDWSKYRDWKLGDPQLKGGVIAAHARFQGIRAAAFYQHGLLPEQRGLLCELAEEVRRGLQPGRSGAIAGGESSLFFFSPETSRPVLRLLTPGLYVKLGTYLRDKNALKEELSSAVIAQDSASRRSRDAAFEKLAESQWPRFAALEELAEQIRRGLAAIPPPPPPPPPLPPQLPPELAARILACTDEKDLLENERVAHIRPLANASIFTGLAEEKKLQPNRAEIALRLLQRREAIAAAARDFRQQNAERYEALEQKMKSVAADLVAFAKTQIDPATKQPMNVLTLMRRINVSEQYFNRNAREEVLYKDYHIAVLEPGLSPEQRRLLFGVALVGLAQALPNGEPLPAGKMPQLMATR